MKRLSGPWGETLARRHALLRGATLVERNARLPAGELDLILRHWAPPHWGTWVFGEVKARRAGTDAALGALAPAQQERILQAATQWLLSRGLDPGRVRVRFDLFAVSLDPRGRPQVTWIQGAFEA